MQRSIFVLNILAVCAVIASPCLAEASKQATASIKQATAPIKPAAPLLPQTYEMSLIFISDAHSHEYIFVINNRVGYRTVLSLKGFVGELTSGSTLRWAPDDSRRSDEPLLSSAAIANFEAFCRSKKIRFVLVPGG